MAAEGGDGVPVGVHEEIPEGAPPHDMSWVGDEPLAMPSVVTPESQDIFIFVEEGTDDWEVYCPEPE
jgi:hypothetical protein